MVSAKTSSKSAKTNGKTTVREFPRTLAGTVAPSSDSARRAALDAYQAAVTLMQKADYKAAHPALEALLHTAPPEFHDRIRMYISACAAHVDKGSTVFQTPEEEYDFAILLLNRGQLEDAREHLNSILESHPAADYAVYGLALLAALTGDGESCLETLSRAIAMNNRNRLYARSDSDFQNMQDDPRFTELLYPEA